MLILVPLSWIALVPFIVAPCIVPEAVMFVAPEMAPVFVIPPVVLSMPPVIDAPPELTVKSPPIVCHIFRCEIINHLNSFRKQINIIIS